MPDPTPEPEPRDLLSALVDGELDAEQRLRALELAAQHPDCLERLAHEQRLKQACAKAMSKPHGRCPDALRRQIEQALDAADPTPSRHGPSHQAPGPVLRRLSAWAPAAAAAVLLITAGVVLYFNNPQTAPSTASAAGHPVSVQHFDQFDRRHRLCANAPNSLKQHELFPTTIDQLDDRLAEVVTSDLADASLDLTSIGYRYLVTGLCNVPGGDAVHLLYQNEQERTISLWIKKADDSLALPDGVPHLARVGDACPLVVWREGDAVFYLMADDLADLERARPQIHLARAS